MTWGKSWKYREHRETVEEGRESRERLVGDRRERETKQHLPLTERLSRRWTLHPPLHKPRGSTRETVGESRKRLVRDRRETYREKDRDTRWVWEESWRRKDTRTQTGRWGIS